MVLATRIPPPYPKNETLLSQLLYQRRMNDSLPLTAMLQFLQVIFRFQLVGIGLRMSLYQTTTKRTIAKDYSLWFPL